MPELAALTAQERSSLLNRWWRVGATGFSFAAFGVGGLVLGGLVAPLLLVVVRHHRRRSALVRWAIHHLFRAFVAMMCGWACAASRCAAATACSAAAC